MEIKIKASVNNNTELKELINNINAIEKEYNCTCTLLDVEIKH